MSDSRMNPVKGVLVMILITVVLAAVIATFVFGLGERVEQNARAGVDYSVSQDKLRFSVTTLDNFGLRNSERVR